MNENDNKNLSNRIKIWTDGACKGNPGKGGWGVVIKRDCVGKGASKRIVKELHGYESITTNNQMELRAAIEALKYLSDNDICINKSSTRIDLTTDSNYVKDGITKWIKSWVLNGWKTAQGKPVKNVLLWKELYQLNRKYRVKWYWVKAHNGHPENTRADELASNAASTQT